MPFTVLLNMLKFVLITILTLKLLHGGGYHYKHGYEKESIK